MDGRAIVRMDRMRRLKGIYSVNPTQVPCHLGLPIVLIVARMSQEFYETVSAANPKSNSKPASYKPERKPQTALKEPELPL